MSTQSDSIPALVPIDSDGHQFVVYADCCSGIPGRGNADRFAAVNAVLQRLDPQPEFILFPGDEIQGLVSDPDLLRKQWRFWFDEEMAWLDRDAISLYHTTANHTVYDPQSEAIFREVTGHLPRNGPPGQEGLSYFVRRGDLLMVFVNTLWSGLGGEGRVETEWLDTTLTAHADARFKLVIGHHPVFPTNGYAGDCQRQIAAGDGRRLSEVLVRHGVMAYLCSHMLAFDVQAHEGVLQIMTAGAGTAPLMPETEYHHLVQMAIDADGLRYQVLDTSGAVRESLSWPLDETARRQDGQSGSPTHHSERSKESLAAATVRHSELVEEPLAAATAERSEAPLPAATPTPELRLWYVTFTPAIDDGRGDPQTLLSGWNSGAGLSTIWIGLRGPEQRLCVLLAPEIGRSPHLWLGPALAESEDGEAARRQVRAGQEPDHSLPTIRHPEPSEGLSSNDVQESLAAATTPADSPSGRLAEFQIAIHNGMGPGGVLWRWNDDSAWTSMAAASPWGAERITWPDNWSIGHDRDDPGNQPFRGASLHIRGVARPWQAESRIE